MAESLTLAQPFGAQAGTLSLHVGGVELDFRAATPRIRIELDSATERAAFVKVYTDTEAVPLLAALNTANLSVKSLQRRALERLLLDVPALAGIIVGTP